MNIKEGFCLLYLFTLAAHISDVNNRKYHNLHDKRESPGEHITLIDVEDILNRVADKCHIRIDKVHPYCPEQNYGKYGVDHRQKSVAKCTHRV